MRSLRVKKKNLFSWKSKVIAFSNEQTIENTYTKVFLQLKINEITSKGVFSLHIFFEETIRSDLKKKTENKNRTLSPGTA